MHDETSDCPSDRSGDFISSVIRSAIRRTAGSYQDFSEQSVPEKPKDFAGFHTACKAALGHLAALVKLDTLCSKEKSAIPPTTDIESILRHTRQVLLSTGHADDAAQDQLRTFPGHVEREPEYDDAEDP